MTFARIEEITTRLQADEFDNADLRRWWREVETAHRRLFSAPPSQDDLFNKCKELVLELPHVMSRHLPQHDIPVARFSPLISYDDPDRVEHYRKHGGDPVILDGPPEAPNALREGRHRLTAARLEGHATIKAVFADEKLSAIVLGVDERA